MSCLSESWKEVALQAVGNCGERGQVLGFVQSNASDMMLAGGPAFVADMQVHWRQKHALPNCDVTHGVR